MSDNQKRGPWSKEDKDYILAHYREKSAAEIANHLRRSKEAVAKYIHNNFKISFGEAAKSAEYDIQKSPVWGELKKQFSTEELKMFIYHWGRIIGQFKDDVFPTEAMQIADAVRLELLMNRALQEQQKCMDDISILERLLHDERREEEPDKDQISSLERQIGVLRAAQESLGGNYKDMLDKKTKIFTQMKATRDQRIKVLEQGKQNFIGWLKNIISDADLRERLGKDMEKMRLAANAEYERLSEFHEYMDGSVDRPILTPENVTDEG